MYMYGAWTKLTAERRLIAHHPALSTPSKEISLDQILVSMHSPVNLYFSVVFFFFRDTVLVLVGEYSTVVMAEVFHAG